MSVFFRLRNTPTKINLHLERHTRVFGSRGISNVTYVSIKYL